MVPASSQTYRVSLDLGAFVKLGFILGLAQGAVFAVLAVVYWLLDGGLAQAATVLLLGPLSVAVSGAVSSLFAFPLVRFWCSRFGYPRLWGVFVPVDR